MTLPLKYDARAAKSELAAVEEPLAQALLEGRHEIRRQVACGRGRADIFDETTGELIECKARGDAESIGAAVDQLKRYRPYFYDPQLAVAVPCIEPDARWLIAALQQQGIRIIEMSKGIGI